jgi:hypothetical protein
VADNRVVTMPEPVDEAQKLAVLAIWDLLVRDGRWPTFHELDQRLYREHELDAARLLPQLPPGLLYGVGHGSNMFIAASTTIGLTIAGVAATGHAQREVDQFLSVVRHAVVLQRNYDPPTDQPDLQPVLTAAEVAVLLGLTMPQDEPLLNRLGAILYIERWGSTGFGGIGSDAWQASIGREVRQFRQVTSLESYWEIRPRHWESESEPGLTEPRPAPTAATTPALGGVTDAAIALDAPNAAPTITDENQASEVQAIHALAEDAVHRNNVKFEPHDGDHLARKSLAWTKWQVYLAAIGLPVAILGVLFAYLALPSNSSNGHDAVDSNKAAGSPHPQRPNGATTTAAEITSGSITTPKRAGPCGKATQTQLFTGTVSNLQFGHQIRLLVIFPQGGRYFPSNNPLVLDSHGVWSQLMELGSPDDKGNFTVLLVELGTSAARSTESYFQSPDGRNHFGLLRQKIDSDTHVLDSACMTRI